MEPPTPGLRLSTTTWFCSETRMSTLAADLLVPWRSPSQHQSAPLSAFSLSPCSACPSLSIPSHLVRTLPARCLLLPLEAATGPADQGWVRPRQVG